MHLRHISVQNFRGIGRARLELGRTTVLLGENDSGKSRLIDALAIAMGLDAEPADFNFRAHDFTLGGGGSPRAINIGLRFEENQPGEWDAEGFDPLRPVMTVPVRERRQVNLNVNARLTSPARPPEPPVQVTWSFRDQRGRAIPATADPELLIWLRLLSPLIVLHEGFLSLGSHALPARDETLDQAGPEDMAGGPLNRELLRQTVEAHYRELTTASPTVSEREIEAGYAAARELVDQAAGIFISRQSRSLLPASGKDDGRGRANERRQHGAGAERLGLLLAVGALLEANVADFWPEAEPIVVIEDPETHLHPLTLASVWDVIASIRWQKVVTTHSGDLLAAVPLSALRRIVRDGDALDVYRLAKNVLKREELRKVSYHVRAKRGTILFARCWLLVEGESEFWILPRLADLVGYELAVEGVAVVEFAQCGVSALIKLANALGIQWFLLSDGDSAGQEYVMTAERYLDDAATGQHITRLDQVDIERCLWHHGYADLYRYFAGRTDQDGRPGVVIQQAIRRHSKPFLALAMAEAAASRGPDGVPPALQAAIEGAVALARPK